MELGGTKRIVCILFPAALLFCSGAYSSGITTSEELHFGSSAEFWQARSTEAKENFVEGLCDGLSTSNQFKLGELRCNESSRPRKYRFCGLRAGNAPQAVHFMDDFYRKNEHSDLAPWVAVAAFNDKLCGEDLVTSRMAKIQGQGKCNRTAANMLEQGASAEAQKKQQEYCASFAK